MDDNNDGDDRDGGDHDEDDGDDDAPMCLTCRKPESNQLMAQIASELEMRQPLQDADCQTPKNCMHKWSMHPTPENTKCQSRWNRWHRSMRPGVKTRWKMPLLRDRECKNSIHCFPKSHLESINFKKSMTQTHRFVKMSKGS